MLVAQYLPADLERPLLPNSPSSGSGGVKRSFLNQAILIGGRLYQDSLVTVGAAAIEILRKIRADICMLGICSLHPDIGTHTEFRRSWRKTGDD